MKIAMITTPDDQAITFEGRSLRVNILDTATSKVATLPDSSSSVKCSSRNGMRSEDEHLSPPGMSG